MQAAVETLTSQVLASERSRAAAESALVELTQRMQEQEKRLNESWEVGGACGYGLLWRSGRLRASLSNGQTKWQLPY